MFDVLVYVYQHFWRAQAQLELPALERKLAAAGFDPSEIEQALVWLEGLNTASQFARHLPSADARPILPEPDYTPSQASMRVYSAYESEHLGYDGIRLIMFLEGTGFLPAQIREIVIDRAMAIGADAISLEDLKIIVLMFFWSAGIQPDILVLDELFDNDSERTAH